MTEIPARILLRATTAVKEISSLMEASPTLGAAATEIIAAAILAERERIAAKADQWSADLDGFTDKSRSTIMWHFAKSIRSGEQP